MNYLNRLVVAICLAVIAAVAHAEEAVFDFNIPAQPVSQVLDAISRETGLQPFYAEESVKGIQSPGVTGRCGLREAVTKALAGTGLIFQFTAEKTVAIMKSRQRTQAMPEVVVTATRTERPVDEVTASVSVLTAKTLATKNRQNVNDALRDVEGLDFSEQPGVAHQVFPVIRGVGGSFAGSTTQVLVDGMAHDSVSSNLMGHGGLNFTAMQDVERVEVVRGPVSALYGPSTIGGVINVIPKRWKGETGVEVNGSYGSHNTRTVGVAAGADKDAFDIRVSVYDAKSDGFVAVPVPDAFGQADAGARDWKDSKIGLIGGFRPADNQEVTLNLQSYATRSAVFGGRPNERQNMDGRSATLGYRYDASDATNIRADVRVADLKQQAVWDSWYWNGAVGDLAVDLAAAYNYGRFTKTTKLQVQMDTHPTDGNQLTAGYSHDTGDYETRSTPVGGTTSTQGSKDKVDALFVQDEHKFGALTLTGGLRYDRLGFSADTVNGVPKNGSASVDNVVTPRLGGRFHMSDTTSLYASIGTAYLPALNAFKFVQPSTTRVDNPNIKPETSTTYEVGMNNRLDWAALRTSLYRTDYKDKVTLGTDPVSAKRQWQNIAVRQVTGIEIALQGNFGSGWQPYANFSYTKAEDQAAAGAVFTQATRVSPRKFNLGVTYEPNSAWSATLNGRAVSGMYFNNLTAAQWAGGYFMADAKITAKLPFDDDKWDAFLAGNNLTNKKYQPFNIGEWSDGRTFTIGIDGMF